MSTFFILNLPILISSLIGVCKSTVTGFFTTMEDEEHNTLCTISASKCVTGSVRFLVDDKEQCVGNIDPNMTLLDFLRDSLTLKGTKEGCASGDCGACTVVLACIDDDAESLSYASVNSCVTLVGNIHGKQVITVEHLEDASRLHHCQKAMVDHHASQCGFCTPGFIMSLFAHSKNFTKRSRENVITSLAGNLCRCTGYQPIIDAGMRTPPEGYQDRFEREQERTINQLKSIDRKDKLPTISCDNRHFFCPQTIDQLAEILVEYPEARLIAGGTDLALEVTQDLKTIKVLVSTLRVKELRNLSDSANQIEIGAAVNFSTFKSAIISIYPDLKELIERFGSLQIRNQCTLGGNIANASPIADMPPLLMILDASVVLRKGKERREIGLQDFYLSYKKTVLRESEFIESIRIPKIEHGHLVRVYKVSKRFEDDISASCGAIWITTENGKIKRAHIAFGGMSEIPKRALNCEKALEGLAWNEETIKLGMEAVRDDFSPITDFRATKDYRLQVSQNLLLRYFHELNNPSANPARIASHA